MGKEVSDDLSAGGQTVNSQFTLGVDLGGTKTEIIALDTSGKECFRKRTATVKGSYPDTIKTISSLVFAAQEQTGGSCPLGIAIPGTVSLKTGVIKNANSWWLNGHDLKADLAAVLGHNEIYLENDANCFALSEAVDGSGKDGDMVWGIILGTGSGSGLIHNKKIWRGRNLLGGEWGHNSLPWITSEEAAAWTDVKCFCGQKNCIETFVSGTGLERDYAKRTDSFDPEAMVYPHNSEYIIEKMREGDATAKASFAAYVSRLARSIANYANFFDPDVIVLGGGMSNIDELYELLPEKIKEYIFGGEFDTPVVKALYGGSSGVRGAAWLPAMHRS